MDLGTLITTRLNIVIEHLSSMLFVLADMHEHLKRAGVEPDFRRLIDACHLIIARYADGVQATPSGNATTSGADALPHPGGEGLVGEEPVNEVRKRKKN